jgi:hypothetical protein
MESAVTRYKVFATFVLVLFFDLLHELRNVHFAVLIPAQNIGPVVNRSDIFVGFLSSSWSRYLKTDHSCRKNIGYFAEPGCGLDGVLGFDSQRRLGIFLFTTASERFWVPTSLLSNGYQGLFPWAGM